MLRGFSGFRFPPGVQRSFVPPSLINDGLFCLLYFCVRCIVQIVDVLVGEARQSLKIMFLKECSAL